MNRDINKMNTQIIVNNRHDNMEYRRSISNINVAISFLSWNVEKKLKRRLDDSQQNNVCLFLVAVTQICASMSKWINTYKKRLLCF